MIIFRLPWDTWSSPSWPLCTTWDQLSYHDQIYYQIADMRESTLIKTTGCSLPCRYREYKLVGKPKEVDPTEFGFHLSFAKTEIVEEKEAYVFDVVSFVSEFGGALGLFVGFSFFAFWDILNIIISAFYKQGKRGPPKIR